MKKNHVIDDKNSTGHSPQDDYVNDDQFEDGIEYEEVELIQVIDEFGNITYEEVPYTGDFSEFEEVEYVDDAILDDGSYDETYDDEKYEDEMYEDEIYEDEIYEDELENDELYNASIFEDKSRKRSVIYEDELTEEERLAYEAEGGIFYVDEDEDDLIYEEYEDIKEEPVYKHLYHKNGSFGSKLKRLFTEGKIVDLIIALTGIIVVIVGVYTFFTWNSAETVEEKMTEMATLGEQLSAIGTAGENGILNVTDAYLTSISTVIEEEEVATTELVEVAVTFTSVEKDLKVKFENADTGELVTGCTFEVSLTDSKDKVETLKDDDRDGIIYDDSMTAGEYSVLIKDVGAYTFPDEPIKVTVKNKIEYKQISIINEIKKESEINVAKEDTEIAAVVEEAVINNTVEWVASTKTAVGAGDGYIPVDKTTIKDPATVASIQGAFAWMTAPADITDSNISINPTSGSMKVNDTENFSAAFVDPGNGKIYTDSDYMWEIVTADSSGQGTLTNATEKTVSLKATKAGDIKLKASLKVTDTGDNSVKIITKTITVAVSEATPTPTTVPTPVPTPALAVTAVDLSTSATSVSKGSSVIITANITSTNGTPTGITWTNPDVANISIVETSTANKNAPQYTVTVGAGYAGTSLVLKATSKDNSAISKDITLTVVSLGVTLDKTTHVMKRNETVTLVPTVVGYKTDGSVTFTSSNVLAATVDAKTGKVTPAGGGDTTITATTVEKNSSNAPSTATCKVTVTPLTIKTSYGAATTMKVGDSIDLSVFTDSYMADYKVTFTNTDSTIASAVIKAYDEVNKATIVTLKALKAGTIKLTATSVEKGSVENKQVIYDITITVVNSAQNDTVTKLKNTGGVQVFVKGTDGKYKEAVYADFYTATAFYIASPIQYTYTGWQTIDNKTFFYDKTGKVVTGAQVIQGVKYNFNSDGSLNMGNGSLGIDVSKWNGTINWTAVKNSGISYVIIRCGYRGSSTGVLVQDPKFTENIKGATAAGLKVGVYFFTQAVNEVEAVEEASMVLSLIKNYSVSYPVFIDTEGSGGRGDTIDKATRTAVCNAFCQTIQNSGYKAGVYASTTWYNSKVDSNTLSAYKIWLAQYADKPTYTGRYDLWQYTSKGVIGGISGNVDLNNSYLGY